ncbi:MAG TPA: amidohydrolase family protein [Stellaceae bacterium]|nr:amidohydrolase family protein [Stellaceae bacterium]
MTALCRPARRSVKAPREKAPAQSVDCHFHIFGPDARYPYAQKRGYTPPEALVPQYEAMIAALGIERMVIVHPSVYGTDNRCSLDSMALLGRERCRMVAVVDENTGEAELKRMDALGVRGVRFNLFNVGGPSRDALGTVARRIAPLGWHLQVYVEGAQLPELAPLLAALPLPVVIDHMGQIMTAWGVDHPAVGALRRLIDGGRGWVKLCGYRSSSAGYPFADVGALARALIADAAERCVWGTDWPHPNFAGTMPDDGELLDLLGDWAPAPSLRRKILVENPAALYGFPL